MVDILNVNKRLKGSSGVLGANSINTLKKDRNHTIAINKEIPLLIFKSFNSLSVKNWYLIIHHPNYSHTNCVSN